MEPERQPRAAASAWPAVRSGALAALTLAPGIVPLGVLYGATAVHAGFSVPSVAAMSAFVFAGVAQFAAAGLYGEGAALAVVAGAVLVINARYLLLTTGALELARQGRASRTQRLLVALLVVDESYALQSSKANDGPVPAAGLIAIGASLWVLWLSASVAGAVVGGRLPDLAPFGLDYALAGLFIGLFAIFADTPARLAAGLAAIAVAAGLTLAGSGTITAVALPALGSIALGRWRRGRA